MTGTMHGYNKSKSLLKRVHLFLVLLIIFTSCLSLHDVRAATKVDIRPGVLKYNDISTLNDAKNKIGRMRILSSSRFPDFFAKGNRMIIAANKLPKYENNEAYLYVENTGNKNVTFCGVEIGMTLSQADRLLKQAKLKKSSSSKYVYWSGEAPLKIKLKNNKIAGWYYTLAPTG